MERIVRLPEVLSLTGLSRSSIYQLISLGRFPRPLKLSERAAGWKVSDVQQWINSRSTSGEKQ